MLEERLLWKFLDDRLSQTLGICLLYLRIKHLLILVWTKGAYELQLQATLQLLKTREYKRTLTLDSYCDSKETQERKRCSGIYGIGAIKRTSQVERSLQYLELGQTHTLVSRRQTS